MKYHIGLNNIFSMSLAGVVVSALVLIGCSGSGDDINIPADPPYDETAKIINGSAVKGPIVNGQAAIYALDLSTTDLKGELVATGTTNDRAEITGLVIPADTVRQTEEFNKQLFLLEVTGGEVAGSSSAPIINSQRVFITGAEARDGTIIYATPLTSLALEMARISYQELLALDASQGENLAFQRAFNASVSTIKTAFGFGVLTASDDIDFRTTAPVKTTTEALNYRTAIEGFSAIVDLIRESNLARYGLDLSNDTILTRLGDDLIDDNIDGQGSSGGIIGLQELQADNALLPVVTRDPLDIDIPGESGLKLNQVNQVLISEMSIIAPDETPDTSLPQPEGLRPPTGVTGDDTDGDGVIDPLDEFYLNPDESSDTDGDCGVVDEANQTPLTGDGCGDNSDPVADESVFPGVFTRDNYCDTGSPGDGDPECADSDGDNVPDMFDVFPNNINQWADKDGDCASVLGYTESDYLDANAGNDCGDHNEVDLNVCYSGGFIVQFTGAAVGSVGLENTTTGERGTGENAPSPLTAELDTVEGIIRTEGLRPYMEVETSGALAVMTSVDFYFELNVNDVASSRMTASNCVDFELPTGTLSVGCANLLDSFYEDINDPRALILQRDWQIGPAGPVANTSEEWYLRPTPFLGSNLLERQFAMYSRESATGNYMGIDFVANPNTGKRSSPWKCDYPYNPALDTLISR